MNAAPRRLRWWVALMVAAAGGLLLDVASPGLAWWPMAFPAIALVCAAVWQQRAGVGALAGLVAGAAFWLPHISWLTLYLGPIPWLGLCGTMLLWFVLFGLAAASATRSLGEAGSRRRSIRLVAIAQALVVAGLWVLREQVQGSWPYGGFPWGRVAHLFSASPLAQSVSWVGFAGLSGLVVFACALPVGMMFSRRLSERQRVESRGGPADSNLGSLAPRSLDRRKAWWAGVAGSLVLLLLLAVLPVPQLHETGTLRVAAVQGNSKSAIFDDRESGSVLNDHIAATADLVSELKRTGESVDVIVWPENSAEFDVRRNPAAGRRIESLSRSAGAPIVVGSVLRNEDGTFTNSSLVWGPDGMERMRYDKRYPVPFAEYMPNREFFHALVPDLVDLVQLEYVPGSRPAAADIKTPVGTVRTGIAICFDIIFDQQAVAMVDAGAQTIFAQTNNADFGRTDESAQQLAIARLRAIETGRAVVNISTVATSAVISPTGTDLATITPHTAGAMVSDIPLVEGRTPALRFGAVIAGAWMLLGGAGLAGAWMLLGGAGLAGALGASLQRRWARR